jgi:uncharacterized protein (DUF302 family)
MEYYFEKTVDYSVEDAVDKVTKYLEPHGFRILTHIDLQKTLHERIGADVRPYRILGACNPNFANEAIGQEANVGLMLPCNIVIQANEDGGTTVAAINPDRTVKTIGNQHLDVIVSKVKDVMQSMINNI